MPTRKEGKTGVSNNFRKRFLNFKLCVYMYVYVHECRCPQRTEASDPLEVRLQVVVSHLTWVLGTDLGSSGGTARSLNH